MSDLFIPDRINVGFQSREDTYTGRLAYVIYWDKKGVLRKEVSWKGWRDKKIPAEEFDNKPQDGFVLNKGIQRYNWSHFGSNRSYIRIYDSRGIEFEITPENLIGLLMETTCSKRGLEGEFVYAWHGKELVLLPCSSEAYGEAQRYTELQGKRISARDLKPGCSYTTKKGDEVIYIGRFYWFRWGEKGRIQQKKHIFAHPTKPKSKYKEWFFFKNEVSFLAVLNNEDPVQNYADLIDHWNKDVRSSIIERWEVRPLKIDPEKVFKIVERAYYESRLRRYVYTEKDGDKVTFFALGIVHKEYHDSYICGYRFTEMGTLDTKKFVYNGSTSRYYDYTHYHGDGEGRNLTREQVLGKLKSCVEVDMVLSSGKKLHLKDIESIAKS